MRSLLLIFLILLIGYSCIKQNTKDPVPALEWVDFQKASKSPYTGRDTALIYITYEDGDGDLFTNTRSEGPNFIFTPFFYNAQTNSFYVEFDPITKDTFRITNTIIQPDPYYKGKSVKGEIYVPLNQFRPNDKVKILKFKGFMTDLKKHKSNVVSSPAYTLNF